ncbi:hypothetical protein QBC43DRAFT_74046 [Cladorrhinum sp. PSN259]|nr:hypothetical protein QBC43DRAFT_74046 [Cladorrhinum sp. PSN259]
MVDRRLVRLVGAVIMARSWLVYGAIWDMPKTSILIFLFLHIREACPFVFLAHARRPCLCSSRLVETRVRV